MANSPSRSSRRIVLAGGTGQVGQLLARHFHARGDIVTVLSRQPHTAPWQVLPWDGRTLGDWTAAIDGADLIINLAGRSVNCRYNAANRRAILDSRVDSTRVIGQAIAAVVRPPALWMNSSTATIYRHAMGEAVNARAMDELTGEIGGNEANAPDTWRFSIDVAKNWESEFFAADTPHTRKTALRSAMVMSPDRGGIFDTLRKLVRLGLGGRAASGKQYISWIHDLDFVNAIEFIVASQDLDGCINLCSPHPLPNGEFMRAFRRAAGVPIGLPATKWMLEAGAFVMRTETELILKSRRVVPTRLLDAGFQFAFPEWLAAARDLIESIKVERR